MEEREVVGGRARLGSTVAATVAEPGTVLPIRRTPTLTRAMGEGWVESLWMLEAAFAEKYYKIFPRKIPRGTADLGGRDGPIERHSSPGEPALNR